ncbi:MAG: SH3 domain-containing protein [Microgenomates group bacterium]
MLDLLAALFISTAHATDYQQCESSSTCTIGEFLYADDYTPLTGASCTLTAKNPDGTAFVTSAAMTGRSDGWYSYDATLSSTTGLYTATICCTPASGLMCLDKSFEVSVPLASAPSAADIWGYSNRTLTSYGTLVNDIWNASTRSLTSFGSLVGDIWSYSNKTLTSFDFNTTSSTTQATNMDKVMAEQQTQRELLEKLVNTPVVSLSLEDGSTVPDLQTKLDDSKKQAGILYDTITSAKAHLSTLDGKWDRLSQDAAISEISSISNSLTTSALTQLSKSWDDASIVAINTDWNKLKDSLTDLLTQVTLNKTISSPKSLFASLTILSDIETNLGDSTNASSDPTLYGHLVAVAERNSTLAAENQKIVATLEDLNGKGLGVATQNINSLKNRVLALNQYPGGEDLTEPAKISDDKKLNLKNILFSLQGLIGLNRMQLAMNVGDPVRSLWLEEGSIIFRAIITNPSSIISQTVPLKFYLPREVKTDDIITLDPSLSTTYDSAQEALFASGSYELKPKQTKIVYVEIQDIWQLTPTELQTLKTQAQNLLKPLEKTAYYSQGVTLKSDIDVTLDKILLSSNQAVTPENRIRAYREGKLELTKVTANMNRLEDLVAQSSGTGSLFGFVGGVQTIAVWGIILVVVAGFVFLALYFKKIGIKPEVQTTTNSSLETSNTPTFWTRPAGIIAIVAVTAISTLLLTRLGGKGITTPAQINQVEPTPSPSPTTTPVPSPLKDEIIIKSEKSVLGESDAPRFVLTVPLDSSVNIRNKPSSDADVVMSVKDSIEVIVFDKDGDWSHIGFNIGDKLKGYWVHSQFLASPTNLITK